MVTPGPSGSVIQIARAGIRKTRAFLPRSQGDHGASLGSSVLRDSVVKPLPMAVGPEGEAHQEGPGQERDRSPDDHPVPGDEPGDGEGHPREREDDPEPVEPGHDLRNAEMAARKSGVARERAFTRAPRRIPSAKPTPSSW